MKERFKHFFGILTPYHFEWNDLRAVLSIINFLLILHSFPLGATFGLIIGTIGLIKDITTHRHINDMALHLTSILLNGYILFFC